jgi:VanZ family protein
MKSSPIGKLYKYCLIFWLILIWFLSSLPADRLPKLDTLNLDKFLHISIYLIFSLLVYKNYCLGLFKSLNRQDLLLIAVVLASLDEAHQVFITNRSVSVFDLAANITGLSIGYFVFSGKRKQHD